MKFCLYKLLSTISDKPNKYSDLSPNTEDGVRIDFDNGWVHMRKSNTEPIVRIFSESDSQIKADKIALEIKNEINSLI